MRLPFIGHFPLSQEFGVNPEYYKEFLVLYPDGHRKPMSGHNGLDFATPHLTEIVAPHAGTVIEASFDQNGYGNYVKIESEDEGSVLAHLDVINVQVGFSLSEGDHVGWSDNTGKSTGPHLHWGYYRFPRDRSNGIAGFIDQTPFLQENGITVALGKNPMYKEALLDTVLGTSSPSSMEGAIDWKGLDPNNKESIQVAINTWFEVASGAFVRKNEYETLQVKYETIEKQSKENGDCKDIVAKYNAFAALGYNTVDDVIKALKDKDTQLVAINTELSKSRSKNSDLAKIISTTEEEDSVALELGNQAIIDNSELRDALVEIAKTTGVNKPGIKNIVGAVFEIKDVVDRLIRKEDKEIEAKKQSEVTSASTNGEKKKDDSKRAINWLLQVLNLFPREVKST